MIKRHIFCFDRWDVRFINSSCNKLTIVPTSSHDTTSLQPQYFIGPIKPPLAIGTGGSAERNLTRKTSLQIYRQTGFTDILEIKNLRVVCNYESNDALRREDESSQDFAGDWEW